MRRNLFVGWSRLLAAAVLLAAFGGCPGSGSADHRAVDAGNAEAGDAAIAGGGLFLSVLPPGNNGNSAGGSGGSAAPHVDDQLALHRDLSYAHPNLRGAP